MYANRELNTAHLLTWADELVGRGILRKEFARFLWSLNDQVTEGVEDSREMEPAKFKEILKGIGVAIPLPDPDDSLDGRGPVAAETNGNGSCGDGVDLLVIMRLPPEADTETRENLSLARQAALIFRDTSGGNGGLKVLFEFDHAGAPYGLPERVMALSHKVGVLSLAAGWRLGGLFLLHSTGIGTASSMILEYDKKRKTFCIEALGQTPPHIQAVQYVVSALFFVARDFPGASWESWMECGLGHEGEKMYRLATSHQKQVKLFVTQFMSEPRESATPLSVSHFFFQFCRFEERSCICLDSLVSEPSIPVAPGARVPDSSAHRHWSTTEPLEPAEEYVQQARPRPQRLVHDVSGCFRHGAGHEAAG